MTTLSRTSRSIPLRVKVRNHSSAELTIGSRFTFSVGDELAVLFLQKQEVRLANIPLNKDEVDQGT